MLEKLFTREEERTQQENATDPYNNKN